MKTKVGRTPRSAPVPLDPLFLQQADEGVGCGPGGPPHLRLQGSIRYAPSRSGSVTVSMVRGLEKRQAEDPAKRPHCGIPTPQRGFADPLAIRNEDFQDP